MAAVAEAQGQAQQVTQTPNIPRVGPDGRPLTPKQIARREAKAKREANKTTKWQREQAQKTPEQKRKDEIKLEAQYGARKLHEQQNSERLAKYGKKAILLNGLSEIIEPVVRTERARRLRHAMRTDGVSSLTKDYMNAVNVGLRLRRRDEIRAHQQELAQKARSADRTRDMLQSLAKSREAGGAEALDPEARAFAEYLTKDVLGKMLTGELSPQDALDQVQAQLNAHRQNPMIAGLRAGDLVDGLSITAAEMKATGVDIQEPRRLEDAFNRLMYEGKNERALQHLQMLSKFDIPLAALRYARPALLAAVGITMATNPLLAIGVGSAYLLISNIHRLQVDKTMREIDRARGIPQSEARKSNLSLLNKIFSVDWEADDANNQFIRALTARTVLGTATSAGWFLLGESPVGHFVGKLFHAGGESTTGASGSATHEQLTALAANPDNAPNASGSGLDTSSILLAQSALDSQPHSSVAVALDALLTHNSGQVDTTHVLTSIQQAAENVPSVNLSSAEEVARLIAEGPRMSGADLTRVQELLQEAAQGKLPTDIAGKLHEFATTHHLFDGPKDAPKDITPPPNAIEPTPVDDAFRHLQADLANGDTQAFYKDLPSLQQDLAQMSPYDHGHAASVLKHLLQDRADGKDISGDMKDLAQAIAQGKQAELIAELKPQFDHIQSDINTILADMRTNPQDLPRAMGDLHQSLEVLPNGMGKDVLNDLDKINYDWSHGHAIKPDDFLKLQQDLGRMRGETVSQTYFDRLGLNGGEYSNINWDQLGYDAANNNWGSLGKDVWDQASNAVGDTVHAGGDILGGAGSWLNEHGLQTPGNVQHFHADPNPNGTHLQQAGEWQDKVGYDWNSDEFGPAKLASVIGDEFHAVGNRALTGLDWLGSLGHGNNTDIPTGGSGGTPELPYGTGALHDIPVPGVRDAEIRIPDGWHFGTHGSDMNVLYDAQGHPVATGFHLDNGELAFRYEPQFAQHFGLDTGVQHLGLEGHDPMVTNAHVTFDGKDVYGNPLRAGGNEAYNMTDYTDGRSLIIHGYGDVGQQANCLYIPAGNGQYMVFEPTGHLADGQPVWQFTPGDNTHLVHVFVNGREMTVTSGQAAQMLHINQGELQNWLANGNPPGASSDFSGAGQSILAHNVMFGQYSFKGGQLDIHQLGVIRGNSGNEQVLQSNVYGFDQKLPPGVIPPGQGGPGAGGPGWGGPGGGPEGGPGGLPPIGEWPGDIVDGVGRLLNAGKGAALTGVILLPSVIGGFMRGTKVGDPSNAETENDKRLNNVMSLGLGELIGFLPLGTPVWPAVGWGAGYLAGRMWARHKVNKAARQAQANTNAPAAGTNGQVGTGTQPGQPAATPSAGPPARTGTPAANNYGGVPPTVLNNANVLGSAATPPTGLGGRVTPRGRQYNNAMNNLVGALTPPTLPAGVTPDQYRDRIVSAVDAARDPAVRNALTPVNGYVPYDGAAAELVRRNGNGLDLANEANARAMAEIMMPTAPIGEKAAAADAIRRAAVIRAIQHDPQYTTDQERIEAAIQGMQQVDTSPDAQKVAMQVRALGRVYTGHAADIIDGYRASPLNTPIALAIVGAAVRGGNPNENIDAGFRAADVDFSNPRRATPAAEVAAIAQAMDQAFAHGPELDSDPSRIPRGPRRPLTPLVKRQRIVERLAAMRPSASRETQAQVIAGLHTNTRERYAEAARLIRQNGATGTASSEDLYGVIRGLQAGRVPADEIQRQFMREVRNRRIVNPTPAQEAVITVMLDQTQGASAADRLGLGLQELAHNPNLTPGAGAGERAEQIADAVVAILDIVGGTGFSAQELQQRMRAEFPALRPDEQAVIAVRVFDALHVPTSSRQLSEQLALALAATGIESQTPNTPLTTTQAEAIADVVGAIHGHVGGLAGLPEAIRSAYLLDNAAAGQVAAVLVENNLNGGVNSLRIIVQEIDDALVPASATAEDYWAILQPAGQAIRAHTPAMVPIPAGSIDAIIAANPTLPVDIQAVMYGAFLPAAQVAGRAGVSAIITQMTTRGGAVIDITQPDQKLALVNGLRLFRSQAPDSATQITEAVRGANGAINGNTRRAEAREAWNQARAGGASVEDQARLAVMVAAPRVDMGPPANIEEVQAVFEELADDAGIDVNIVRQAMNQLRLAPDERQAVVHDYIRHLLQNEQPVAPLAPGANARQRTAHDDEVRNQITGVNRQIVRALAAAGYPPGIAGNDATMVGDVRGYVNAGGLALNIPNTQLVFI